MIISPEAPNRFSQKFVHIFYRKKNVPKNFGHHRKTLGRINPEFDFFTTPLKMQKKFKNFFDPSVP